MGYDLKDYRERQRAISELVRIKPWLAPSYGWTIGPSSARNPIMGTSAQPPDQVVSDSIAAGPLRRK